MKGKRILLGVTGGIAAYKITSLIRLLKKSGAEVKCIMTPASSDFISPLTLSTLSKNPVGIEFWNEKDGTWNNHVDYGMWADLFVVAPLTMNTLAKMVSGQCDNLLMASYFSMKCPVMVAPAMDLDMYAHPSTQRNLITVQKEGVKVLFPESGELASGLIGEGRMQEPEKIYQAIESFFESSKELQGKKILITAGPTFEAIDPVRFIGNHSSGKMGFALAEECAKRGAEVILIAGVSRMKLKNASICRVDVQSADQMLSAVQKYWNDMDAGIFAAAVADYKPKSVAVQKIKKQDDELTIELIKNPDILLWAGKNKSEKQVLAGFALETNDPVEHANGKLTKKNLDFIVINTLEEEGAGFGHDTNKISILDKGNKMTSFELMSKEKVAENIVIYLNSYLK